jgi:hypothetical protein
VITDPLAMQAQTESMIAGHGLHQPQVMDCISLRNIKAVVVVINQIMLAKCTECTPHQEVPGVDCKRQLKWHNSQHLTSLDVV